MTRLLLLLCLVFAVACDEEPTVKTAVAKIAGVEGVEMGFGGGTASVYRAVASDGSTCRISVGFYAMLRLPSRVSCFWGAP